MGQNYAKIGIGTTGPIGPTGSIGPTGPIGIQGSPGVTGPQGGTGPFPYYAPIGITGSTVASRYVGGTTGSAPLTGTFNLNDFVTSTTGRTWICVSAGSPGKWATTPDVAIFRPIDYSNGNTYDPTGVNDSTTSFTAMMTAVNAYAGNYLIQLPPGTFKISTGTLSITSTYQGAIVGAGMYATSILPTNSTSDIILFNGSQSGFLIADFAFSQTGAPQTNGNAINTNGSSDILIRNIYFNNMFGDVIIQASSNLIKIVDCYSNRVNGSASGYGITVSVATNVWINGYVMINTGTNRCSAGIDFTTITQSELNNCFIQGAAIGLQINPAGGQSVQDIVINSCVFDAGTSYGTSVSSSYSTSVVKDIKFIACQFSNVTSSGSSGVYLWGSSPGVQDSIIFDNCRSHDNYQYGFYLTFGTNIQLIGCDVRGNSTVSSGLVDGIYVASGVGPIRIIGGKSGGSDSSPTGATQQYGLNLVGGNTVATILGTDLFGNVNGPLSNSSTGQVAVVGCYGMPALPASTVPATTLGATSTYITSSFPFPAYSLQPGSAWQCEVDITSATTPSVSALTGLIKWGTAGTLADQSLLSGALATGTAIAGIAKLRFKTVCKSIGNTTTFYVSLEAINNTLGVTNSTTPQLFNATINATSKSTAANYLGIAITESASGAHVVSSTSWSRFGDKQ